MYDLLLLFNILHLFRGIFSGRSIMFLQTNSSTVQMVFFVETEPVSVTLKLNT